MMTIWGRKDGVNVIKVMWCVGELGLAHDRMDLGGSFGGLDDPDYRAMNPMGRMPTIDDDGFVLWESNTIVRYLCAKYASGLLYPEALTLRAEAEKWMDWTATSLQPATKPFRTELATKKSDEDRDMIAVAAAKVRVCELAEMLDRHLADHAWSYLAGNDFTMADVPAGALMHRWFALVEDRPRMPNLDAWYERIFQRPAYQFHCVQALGW